MEANTFSYLTSEVAAKDYASISLNRERNVLVRCDKADSFRNSKKIVGPNLDGVSGGPLWRMSGGGSATLRMPLLTAIAIS